MVRYLFYTIGDLTYQSPLVANYFYRKTQFPNCTGAMYGKHIRIKMPTGSVSLLFSWKYVLVLLLALVDADYWFIAVDVGSFGKSSNSKAF